MTKRYAKDFDPATPVVELCRYSNAIEHILALEAKLAECGEALNVGGQFIQAHINNDMMPFNPMYPMKKIIEALDDPVMAMQFTNGKPVTHQD